MRRNLLLGLFLPSALVLTTIGTSFAVWYFGENEAKKDDKNMVDVDKYVDADFGTLSISYGNENDENYIGPDHDDKEVFPILYITQTDIAFASPIKVSFAFKNDPNMDYTAYTYSFHYEITLSEEFTSYFRMLYPGVQAANMKTATGYLNHKTIGTLQNLHYSQFESYTITSENDTYGFFEAELPVAFAYRSGAIPTSEEAFKDMWDKLNTGMETTPLVSFSYYLSAVAS